MNFQFKITPVIDFNGKKQQIINNRDLKIEISHKHLHYIIFKLFFTVSIMDTYIFIAVVCFYKIMFHYFILNPVKESCCIFNH